MADVFDALTHARPYKTAWTVPDSVREMQRLCGVQFDPAVIEVFNELDHHQIAGVEPAVAPRLTAVG